MDLARLVGHPHGALVCTADAILVAQSEVWRPQATPAGAVFISLWFAKRLKDFGRAGDDDICFPACHTYFQPPPAIITLTPAEYIWSWSIAYAEHVLKVHRSLWLHPQDAR